MAEVIAVATIIVGLSIVSYRRGYRRGWEIGYQAGQADQE